MEKKQEIDKDFIKYIQDQYQKILKLQGKEAMVIRDIYETLFWIMKKYPSKQDVHNFIEKQIEVQQENYDYYGMIATRIYQELLSFSKEKKIYTKKARM